jgi:hypothetical protein
VWTDSRAAHGDFIGSLDDNVEFVCRTLELPHPKEPIPAYVFRNPEGYYDFCEQHAGFSREEARETAGHGCGRYFAVYYMRPNSAVVVHELTHTLVARTYGPWGGSWLQEGFAVYVQRKFEKKDIVKTFAVHLRNGRHEPLATFVAEKALAESRTRKEEGRVSRLYDQAGAFFAFLKDGPHKDRFSQLVKVLTGGPGDPKDRVRVLEKLYEKKIHELEEEWVKWGTTQR